MFVATKLFHKAGEGSGGGGGDQHNLGWYATPNALRTAHPTAENGDWAIVGSTDTVWVWDSDTSAWKDTDTKGQVTSVNGQTGAVTVQETLVNQTNIKSVDGNSLLGSGNLELSTYLTYPAGWTTNSTTKAFCDGIAADTTATKGKAYLGEVTCSDLPASMANGEVIVEIMDGTTSANKVIVLTLTSGNTSPYMWKYTYWNGGSDVSGWKTWATSSQGAKADTAVQPADLATVATTGQYSDLSGKPTIPDPTQVSTLPTASADELGNIYQFVGTTDANYTNGYFYKCVSDGATPAVYSWTAIEVQAGGGLPSQTGQSGKFLTTDGTNASWSDKPLVNTATGTNALTIFGTPTTAARALNIGNNCSATSNAFNAVAIGNNSVADGNGAVAVGSSAKATGGASVAISGQANMPHQAANAVAIGAKVSGDKSIVIMTGNTNYYTNITATYSTVLGYIADPNTIESNSFYVGIGMSANQTIKLLSSDGTIPTARLTKVNSTVTLTAADWSSNTQTVSVTGMTATGIVLVSPDPTDQSAYTSAGIICSAQAAGTLTFTCSTTPSADLSVNVVML